MKQKFTSIPSRTVEIARNGESITLTMTALPLGWIEHLSAMYPEPVEYINGEEVQRDDPEYWGLYGYLQLAKGLEPSGELDTPAPQGGDRKMWDTYARAVREEFREAGLLAGDYAQLLEMLNDLSKTSVKKTPDLGKN
ncbi:MAG: hypothetical protein AAFV53_31740 [Myxococcota bacterium]